MSKPKSSSKAKRPPLTARGEQAREKLKQAATRVLERKGYHQMKVSDVTSEAKVAAGLFYHYFSDLKSLTLEVLRDLLKQSESFAEIEKHVARGDWYHRILSHMTLHVGHYADHPGLMRCLFQMADEDAQFGSELQSNSMRQLQWMADLVPKLFPNSNMSSTEALLVIQCLGNSTSGFLRDYYINQTPELVAAKFKPAEVAEMLAVVFYRGLFLQNPPQEQLKFGKKIAEFKRVRGV